jgi:hypothetical protein
VIMLKVIFIPAVRLGALLKEKYWSRAVGLVASGEIDRFFLGNIQDFLKYLDSIKESKFLVTVMATPQYYVSENIAKRLVATPQKILYVKNQPVHQVSTGD